MRIWNLIFAKLTVPCIEYFIFFWHTIKMTITFQLHWWWFHPRQYFFPNTWIAKIYLWLLITVFSHFPLPIPFIALTELHPDNACKGGRLFKRPSSKSLFPMPRIRKLNHYRFLKAIDNLVIDCNNMPKLQHHYRWCKSQRPYIGDLEQI